MVTAVVGRYPDALWLAWSFAGMSCGAAFGTSDLYRWRKDSWVPAPLKTQKGTERVGQFRAYSEWLAGQGALFGWENAEGDSLKAPPFVLSPIPKNPSDDILDRATPTDVYDFGPGTSGVSIAPSGKAFVLGGRRSGDDVLFGTILGKARRLAAAPKLGDGLVPAAPLFARADNDVTTVTRPRDPEAPKGKELVLANFDGAHWSTWPTSIPDAPSQIARSADGVIWVLGSQEREPTRLWQRTPEGSRILNFGNVTPQQIVGAADGSVTLLVNGAKGMSLVRVEP
jgi:hypothetical protein